MGIYDMQEKIIAEKDARIAELTAEVGQVRELNRKLGINNDKLRASLQEAITHMYSDATVRELYAARENARNALKEG